MSVNEAVYVFGRTAHQMRSHSFASIILPSRSVGSAVMITIFPVLSISTRAMCTPAVISGPCQGAATNAGKHGFRVRKVRKVGKVLGVITRTPFLTFLVFLAFLALVLR